MHRECPIQLVEETNPLKVFITVSSLAKTTNNNSKVVSRQLELNWYNAIPQDRDWVGLWTESDPRANWTEPLERAWVVGKSKGFYRTSVTFPMFEFTAQDLKYQCLNFWVAYVRGKNETVAVECLKIRPTWMWDSRKLIGGFSLSQLMIPGTHNSGSYQDYRGKRSETLMTRYKICQDEDIWNQLIYGIRHFDLRIGYYYKENGTFWLNHEFLKIHPFSVALKQIKEFLLATNEILVLDFHRFPVGFRSHTERYREFIQYITGELGDYMIPRSYGHNVTLNQLWSRNQRLLVTYSGEHFTESQLLWPGLPQVWASTNQINRLCQHFSMFMSYNRRSSGSWEAKSNGLWAAMAELTPTMWDAFSNNGGSLRTMADTVNRNVTQWFREAWWDSSNIVATDFFHGNNIIEVAIESNAKRKWCKDMSLRPHPLMRPPYYKLDGNRLKKMAEGMGWPGYSTTFPNTEAVDDLHRHMMHPTTQYFSSVTP